jgi:DNA-binding transcriptional ArsR family regulator
MDESELVEVKTKLRHLEDELNAVKKLLQHIVGRQDANPSMGNTSVPNQIFDPAAAEAAFRQTLMTLRSIAVLRNERFIFIATADPQNVTTSGPQPVQALLTEEIKPLLAKLGAALSNPTRLKMLFILMLQDECTTGLLAETSGVSGGNLFQQLNELYSANLILQPSRGRYRLTESGRIVVEVLSWAVSNVGKAWTQPGWFENGSEKFEEG